MKYIYNKPTKKAEFIKSYIPDKNKLKVKYANGGVYYLPNEKAFELDILAKMDNQAANIPEAKKELDKDTLTLLGVVGNAFLIFWAILMTTYSYELILSTNYLLGAILGTIAVGMAHSGATDFIDSFKAKRKLKDIKKTELFLKNKQELAVDLKQALEKDSKNILLGVNKTATKEIKANKNNDFPAVNINTINNLSDKEIRTLLENLKRFKSFYPEAAGEMDTTNTLKMAKNQ